MKIHITRNRRKRGGALLIAVFATVVCAGMAAGLMAVTGGSKKEHRASTEHMQALYVAEAGLNSAIDAVRSGTPVLLGDAADPVPFSSGSYWGTSVDNGDDTFTITVYGTSHNDTRGFEAVLVKQGEGVYSSALF